MIAYIAFILLLWPSVSWGQRPTEGGLFAFDDSDEIAFHDYQQIRVHYSISGVNQVILDDNDQSGIPDFVEEVALTAQEVLLHFQSLGFHAPLSEQDMGLEDLGGSTAFDFYLVDFGGSADGHFGVDTCDGCRCSGYMVMENDFAGYGYSSLSEAIHVLVSHEFFHAIQASYHGGQPIWMSEGMAVWAEYSFDSNVADFYAYARAYLQDTERSLDRPPVGPLPTFAYSTALFFAFVEIQLGAESLVSLQENLATCPTEGEEVAELISVIEEAGLSIEELWHQFAQWNVITGNRSGELESYPFANLLFSLNTASEGILIDEDHRFYPLSASYFKLEHQGGELRFVLTEETEGVMFSLYQSAPNDTVIVAAIEHFPAIGPMEIVWEDLPAGDYWLVGSYPSAAPQSEKFQFCLGSDCTLLEQPPEPVTETGEEAEEPSSEESEKEAATGCASSGGLLLWPLFFVFYPRRQRCG